MVEAGDSQHAAEGEAQLSSHLIEGRWRQIAVQFLHLVEHFNQRIRPTAKAAHDLGDPLAVIQW